MDKNVVRLKKDLNKIRLYYVNEAFNGKYYN